jgi:FkbM family methyltransferase
MSPTPSPSSRPDAGLPLCRFRRPAAQAGAVWCGSPVLRLGGAVHRDICRGCACPDVASLPGAGVRAPCLYRGGLGRHAPRAHGPDRGEPVEVFWCGVHGECTESRVADGVTCCAACPEFRPRDTSPAAAGAPENSVEAMTALLRGPRRGWPDDWPHWGTTLEAHRLLAAEFEKQIPPYPRGRYKGRGVVILGGGPFFPGVYVTVRMLRHFGCELPIEVWHHGASEPVLRHWLEPAGVRFIDLEGYVNGEGPRPRIHGAWASKIYAILHSSFAEVLYLDSDCYPLVDVTPLFDACPSGALFWPDSPLSEAWRGWVIHPAPARDTLLINTGQLVLDKAKCWDALRLAQWWAERADYSFAHNPLGDQDVLRGVWHYLGRPYTMFSQTPVWVDSTYLLCLGEDGRTPVFLHRIQDKFRVPWLPLPSAEGDRVKLYRWDRMPGETQYRNDLPGEELAFGYFREFQRRFDDDPARYRAGTIDRSIWEETVTQNCYRLPERLPPGSRVIDVGAHIGSFTHLALRRGAARVWAFEPDADNWAQGCANLALWGARAALRRQAVWSARGRAGSIPPPRDMNAVGRVVPEGDAVETVPLDDVLDEASEAGKHSVYLLKLDCEGGEWPILFTSERLSLCENIVGEYHCLEWDGKRRGPDDLCRLLVGHGFEVHTSPSSDGLGLFWATRTGEPRGTTR